MGTTSTVAALPVALEEADENLEVTHEVANLVLPLGASMYRGGSALFQGAAIVFLASMAGLTEGASIFLWLIGSLSAARGDLMLWVALFLFFTYFMGANGHLTLYLTDQTDSTLNNTYYKMSEGNFDSGNTADFIVRFPANAQIASGATITIAIDGSQFQATYGAAADYACRNSAGGSVDMLIPSPAGWVAGPIAPYAELFDSGESVVIFSWDGQTDLVQDVDYVFYGSAASVGTYDGATAAIDPPSPLTAGAELGTFHLGSTVILVAPPGRWTWSVEAGQPVRVGRAIARGAQ